MLNDWAQGSASNFRALKKLKLEKHFNTGLFPEFMVTNECTFGDVRFIALYHNTKHVVKFNHDHFHSDKMWFVHTYFHELIHSTTFWNGRYRNMWVKCGNFMDYEHVGGLEERIADIGALVLCGVFETDFGRLDYKQLLICILNDAKTDYALPWGDLEQAVLFYLKKKDCSKVKQKLQLIKEIIIEHNLTTIYEGAFNGQVDGVNTSVSCA